MHATRRISCLVLTALASIALVGCGDADSSTADPASTAAPTDSVAETTLPVAPTSAAPNTVAPTTVTPTTTETPQTTSAPTTVAPTTVAPTTIAAETTVVVEPETTVATVPETVSPTMPPVVAALVEPGTCQAFHDLTGAWEDHEGIAMSTQDDVDSAIRFYLRAAGVLVTANPSVAAPLHDALAGLATADLFDDHAAVSIGDLLKVVGADYRTACAGQSPYVGIP